MATGTDIWDTSALSPAGAVAIARALSRCTMDFNLLRAGLQSVYGRTTININIRDLSSFAQAHEIAFGDEAMEGEHNHDKGYDVLVSEVGVLGLFWWGGPTAPLVEVEQSLLSNPDLFDAVFHAEGAHATDFCYLDPTGQPTASPNSKRAVIYALMCGHAPRHPWLQGTYNEQVGEGFMGVFVRAFTNIVNSPIQGFLHTPSDSVVQQIRDIMMPAAPPPPPPPEPPTPPAPPEPPAPPANFDQFVIDISYHKLTLAQATALLRDVNVKGVVQCLWDGLSKPNDRILNLRVCQEAGLPYAGYISLNPNHSGRFDVDRGREFVASDLWNGMAFVAIDVEVAGLTYQHVFDAAASLYDNYHKAGVIYTSYDQWRNKMGNPLRYPGWMLWNASWDGDPDIDYQKLPFGAWQTTELIGEQFSGGVDIEGVHCDRNMFRSGIFAPPPPPPEPPAPPPEPPAPPPEPPAPPPEPPTPPEPEVFGSLTWRDGQVFRIIR